MLHNTAGRPWYLYQCSSLVSVLSQRIQPTRHSSLHDILTSHPRVSLLVFQQKISMWFLHSCARRGHCPVEKCKLWSLTHTLFSSLPFRSKHSSKHLVLEHPWSTTVHTCRFNSSWMLRRVVW